MVENLDRTSSITGEDQLSALNIDIAVSEICVGKRSYEPVDVSDVPTHPCGLRRFLVKMCTVLPAGYLVGEGHVYDQNSV